MPRLKPKINFTPGANLKPRTRQIELTFGYEKLTRLLSQPIQIPNVNRVIREMRVSRGVSQKTLSRALKYSSRTYISGIELGRHIPSIAKTAQIAHALGYRMEITFVPIV